MREAKDKSRWTSIKVARCVNGSYLAFTEDLESYKRINPILQPPTRVLKRGKSAKEAIAKVKQVWKAAYA